MTLHLFQKEILKEVLTSWFIVILGSKAFILFGQLVPAVADYAGIILSALLIYVPLLRFYKRDYPIDFLKTKKEQLIVSLSSLLLACGLIFSAAILFVSVMPGFSFLLHSPQKIGAFLIYQLVTVAFPEEFFFRGYMQERFNLIWPKNFNFFGVAIGPSLFVTSLIFALSHSIISFQSWHILIFFPSLIFGLLREKTGGIWASIFFHAFCNLFSFFVMIRL